MNIPANNCMFPERSWNHIPMLANLVPKTLSIKVFKMFLEGYEITITQPSQNLVLTQIASYVGPMLVQRCTLQWPKEGIQRWTSVVLTAGAWLAKRCNTTLIQ